MAEVSIAGDVLCTAQLFMLMNIDNVLVGWLEWKAVFTRFIPLGLCLITVMQWRAYRSHVKERTARKWEISCYCMLPLRTVSRYWGWFAGIFLIYFHLFFLKELRWRK